MSSEPESLETISKDWQTDSIINEQEAGSESVKSAKLHSKYLAIYTRHNLKVKKLDVDFYRLKKNKWKYYSGKMSKEELKEKGWEPFQYVLKQDVNVFLDADEDLIKILLVRAYHQEVVDFCKSVLDQISKRGWLIKNYIDWQRFISGG